MPTMDEFGDWTERLWRQPFPAKVTAKTNMNGVWYYTWTEQSLAASTGAYEDALGARTGDATDAWAREMNNREVATNTIVMMRFRGMAASGGGPTFEFMAPDDSVTNTTTNTTYTNTTVTYTNTTVNCNTNSVVNVTNTSTYNFQAGSTIIFGGPTVNMTANTSVTLSSTTVLTVTGGAKVVMETPLEVCGYMFWCYQTETPWAADQNDWTGPSFAGTEAVLYRIGGTAARNLTGMVAEGDGQVVCLLNVEGFDITLKHDDAGSTAANRFYLPNNADLILGTGCAAICWYDPIDTRWAVLATSGEIGGGGGTISGSGSDPYYAYFTAANTLANGSIVHDGNYNESASTFRVGAGTVNSHYYLGVYGDTTGNKALYLHVAGSDGFISLDSTGFYDSSVSNPYPGDLTLQFGAANTECILIGGPMSQTRFCTYDGPGTGVQTGVSGTIGPGATSFGGIVTNTGSGSMGTVTSLSPGSGITTSSNPITTTGTITLSFKGPFKWGVD